MIEEFIKAIDNGYKINYAIINLDFLNEVRKAINKKWKLYYLFIHNAQRSNSLSFQTHRVPTNMEFPIEKRLEESVVLINEEIENMRNYIRQKYEENNHLVKYMENNMNEIESMKKRLDVSLFEVNHLVKLLNNLSN